MRRISMVLMVAVVIVVAVAVPAMAQDDKAAKKAARQAEKAARQAEKAAKKAQDPTPAPNQTPAANDASKKALPSTGGSVVNLALLGGGSLLVGGGIVALRVARR